MELHDPVAVYTAGSNLEAHQLAEELIAAGINSQVVEDNGTMGVLDTTSKHPQVWVSSTDLERAGTIAANFDGESRHPAPDHQVPVGLQAEWIDVTCDKCRTVTRFAPIHKGTIVNCPNCFAFMDVGDDVAFDDWNVIEQQEDSDSESGDEAPE